MKICALGYSVEQTKQIKCNDQPDSQNHPLRPDPNQSRLFQTMSALRTGSLRGCRYHHQLAGLLGSPAHTLQVVDPSPNLKPQFLGPTNT